MRLRIQTEPPLPNVKAWFSFPQSECSSNSLDALKTSLCCHIKTLNDAKIKPSRVRLVMDDYELLDELEVEGILRDGDCIVLQEIPLVGTKRKAEGRGLLFFLNSRYLLFRSLGSSPVKKRKIIDSDSSDSSSSDSSSDSDSDSSDSSSSDDTSSDDSSVPSIRNTKQGLA